MWSPLYGGKQGWYIRADFQPTFLESWYYEAQSRVFCHLMIVVCIMNMLRLYFRFVLLFSTYIVEFVCT